MSITLLISLVFANRWHAFDGFLLIPLIVLSLDGVFRECFAVDFSPFYIRFHLIGAFFIVPAVLGSLCKKNLVLIFARKKSRLILFSDAVGKGKGLALHAHPRVAGPNTSPYMVSPAVWRFIS